MGRGDLDMGCGNNELIYVVGKKRHTSLLASSLLASSLLALVLESPLDNPRSSENSLGFVSLKPLMLTVCDMKQYFLYPVSLIFLDFNSTSEIV